MKHINLVANLMDVDEADNSKDLAVTQLFEGGSRKILGVRLKNGAVLARHKADVPITVLCLAGSGTFTAGADLEDSQELRAGTLITLEAGIEHEVTAEPSIHILVSKFTGR
jgi:quercetin dioxygenase-like cupin family protein